MAPQLIEGIQLFEDHRGQFYESYKESLLKEKFSIKETFLQDNHSISVRNTIRGLHYQWDKPMGKLVRVCYGSIIDVSVDIRVGSKTFGNVYYFNLNEQNLNQVYVPPGYAHGFVCLSDIAHVLYKCTSEYNKEAESGINPFDESLKIDWKIDLDTAIVSKKDIEFKSFEEYKNEAKFEI